MVKAPAKETTIKELFDTIAERIENAVEAKCVGCELYWIRRGDELRGIQETLRRIQDACARPDKHKA